MRRIHVVWAVAATVLLVAGLALGRTWSESAAPEARNSPETAAIEDKRPLFALMLYEDSNYQVAPAGEDRAAEYSAWAKSLAQRGHLVDGAELSVSGLMLAPAQAPAEAVPTSKEGVLAGYFVIRAADRDEAERIARECPHLKYQGTISLRAIEM